MAIPPSQPRVAHEAARYAAVGLVCAGVDQGVALLLDQSPISDLASSAIGGAIGISLSYLLCVRWVFTHRAVARRAHEAGLFALIALLALACKVAAFAALSHGLGFGSANAGAMVIGGTIAFTCKKLVLFRGPPPAPCG